MPVAAYGGGVLGTVFDPGFRTQVLKHPNPHSTVASTSCSQWIVFRQVRRSIEKLVEHVSALEDPRCAGKVDHRLIDILIIAVCAGIACAASWDDTLAWHRKIRDPIVIKNHSRPKDI